MALRRTSALLVRELLSGSPSPGRLPPYFGAASCHISFPCSRGLSQDSARDSGKGAVERSSTVTYGGPLAKTLTNLKVFSLASCVASFASAPIIVFFAPDGGLAAKLGLAGLMCGFSALTTGLLHWLTGPYVHSLEYTPATQRLRIRTLSVLCQAVHTDAHLQEVAYPADTLRPQVTFQAGGRFFYVDADAFRDKELLSKLSPPEPLPLK